MKVIKPSIVILSLLSIQLAQAGQLVSTKDYNSLGQQTSQGDTAGKQVKNLAFDTYGHVILTEDLQGQYAHALYGRDDQLLATWVDNSNNPHEAIPIQAASNDDELIQYQYDPLTHALKQVRRGSMLSDYTYYLDGKTASLKQSNGKGLEYEFRYRYDDTLGVLISKEEFINGKLTNTLHYTYYPNTTQLQFVTVNDKVLASYDYNELGDIEKIERLNGLSTKYDYNQFNQVTDIKEISSQQKLIGSFHYVYYRDGNVKSSNETLRDGQHSILHYVYNAEDQLIHYDCEGVCAKDARGRLLTSQDFQYTLMGGLHQISEKFSDGKTSIQSYHYEIAKNYPTRLQRIDSSDPTVRQAGDYQYDDNGNMVKDPMGNIYYYNRRNEMTKLQGPEGHLKVSYHYNSNGLVDQQTAAGEAPLNYLYGAANRLVAQQQGSIQANYIAGADGRLATIYDHEHDASDRYFLENAHGDITSTASLNNDQEKTEYLYTPYGVQTRVAKSPVKGSSKNVLTTNHFGYTGQQYDSQSGFMMLGGYRAYDPKVGSFMKQDSVDSFAIPNGFAYVDGNPIMNIDPTGNFSWEKFGIGAGIFAASSLAFLVAGPVGVTAVQGVGADLMQQTVFGDDVIDETRPWVQAGIAGGVGAIAAAPAGPAAAGAKAITQTAVTRVASAVLMRAGSEGLAKAASTAVGFSIGVAAGAVSGAAENATNQGLTIAAGYQDEGFNWQQLGIAAGVGAVLGRVGTTYKQPQSPLGHYPDAKVGSALKSLMRNQLKITELEQTIGLPSKIMAKQRIKGSRIGKAYRNRVVRSEKKARESILSQMNASKQRANLMDEFNTGRERIIDDSMYLHDRMRATIIQQSAVERSLAESARNTFDAGQSVIDLDEWYGIPYFLK